ADFLHAIKIHDAVADLLAGHTGDRSATGDHGEQVIPAAADATAMLFDDLFEADAHGFFEGRGLVHMARDAHQLGAGIVGAADAGEPGAAATEDFRHDRDGFDIVDGG